MWFTLQSGVFLFLYNVLEMEKRRKTLFCFAGVFLKGLCCVYTQTDRHSPRVWGWAHGFHDSWWSVGWIVSTTSMCDRGLVCLQVSSCHWLYTLWSIRISCESRTELQFFAWVRSLGRLFTDQKKSITNLANENTLTNNLVSTDCLPWAKRKNGWTPCCLQAR